jgi:hypothetical protein
MNRIGVVVNWLASHNFTPFQQFSRWVKEIESRFSRLESRDHALEASFRDVTALRSEIAPGEAKFSPFNPKVEPLYARVMRLESCVLGQAAQLQMLDPPKRRRVRK